MCTTDNETLRLEVKAMAAINDATMQKAGDIYQYFVALLDCFSLSKGETMLIETKGDVSIVSSDGKNRFQKEIKHHFGKSNLAGRSVDFWNTLDNWCKERNDMSFFTTLIFYTTSTITSQSIFHDWNKRTPQERYDILQKCGLEIKEREKSFREHYNSIFALSKADVEAVLEKIEIWPNQRVISELDVLFAKETRQIPQENKRKYIESLLGQILGKVVDPPHKWEVKQEEFDQMVIDNTALYAKASHVYLETLNSGTPPTTDDLQALSEKVFVKEIERIKYKEVIPDAVVDYWRTHTQVLLNAQNNILFMESLPEYRNDLLRKLESAKRQAKRQTEGQDHAHCINASQNMYDQATAWDAKDFGHIVGNAGYFQNGVIHGIVDDKKFEWSLEVEDEH